MGISPTPCNAQYMHHDSTYCALPSSYPIHFSGFQHLVPLLPSPQPLHPLLVHLLRHLLIPLLLLLGSALILDCLYPALQNRRTRSALLCPQGLHCNESDAQRPTCLLASFSSFISFSCALTTSSSFAFSARFANDVWPAVGRNAVREGCHCLPFLRMPFVCDVWAAGAGVIMLVDDILCV